VGTKSGRKSLESGERYLPKRAREALSDEEYRATSDKKRRDLERGRQHSRQPKRIAEKTAKYRDGGTGKRRQLTRSDLYEQPRRRDLPGRSRMSKAELAQALKR
jgi:curved DNA-binding protein CbpA